MKFFWYGRKSVYSDHSDSVDNQERMCKGYVQSRFAGQVESWTPFSDEDFSGANTDRPALHQMMTRIKAKECDALIVYQLDRLSRNVRDFSNLYAILDSLGVKFISLKENIDTATPIGRAMMYVTVVFAQMERETTAVRVADNMAGLAKKGYWVGGNPPIGYVRKHITVDGRKHCIIVPDPEGVRYVKKVFSDFLSLNCSLQHMETVYRKAGIRTAGGKFFATTSLYRLLTSPLYVRATSAVYDYFAEKGCQMDPGSPRSSWDGSRGVMIYGRTTQRGHTHIQTPPEKWLVSLGRQEPFIDDTIWLEVQKRFVHNNCIKATRWPIPLLKGVLRCGCCGSLMQVSRKARVDGSRSSAYYCRKRMRQGKDVCPVGQVKCQLLDDKVMEIFRRIEADPKAIMDYVESKGAFVGPDPSKLRAETAKLRSKVAKLTESLTIAAGGTAEKYIISEIEKLDQEIRSLNKKALEADAMRREAAGRQRSLREKTREISDFISGMDGFDDKERNEIVRKIIKKATWDGETLVILL